jgi:hypothetical protein
VITAERGKDERKGHQAMGPMRAIYTRGTECIRPPQSVSQAKEAYHRALMLAWDAERRIDTELGPQHPIA